MFFIILAQDRPGALPLRLAQRQRHLDYWNSLPGIVKIGGALLDADAGPKGSSFIIEADNLDQARSLLANDPFMLEGIFAPNPQIEAMRPAIGAWLA